MYNMNHLELFYFHLEKFIYILKSQDKKLVEYWINKLRISLDAQYIESLLTAAVFELSAKETNTFHWVIDNFCNCNAYIQLLENVTRFAIKKLIKKGFIPGQDFSVNSQRKILLSENIKTDLMADISESDALLIEKVLLIPKQVCSLTS